MNLIAEEKQLSNELMSKLKQKTNELKVLSGQLKTSKDLKNFKDTQEIHDLKQKLVSSKHECEKARSHLVKQQKENENNKKMIKLEEEVKRTLKIKNNE